MSTINKFINSLPGQFLIGGLTVAGINYFSNNIANTAIAGVIAGVPVGLPSTIFVKDAKVSDYSTHLLFMTAILFFVTLLTARSAKLIFFPNFLYPISSPLL